MSEGALSQREFCRQTGYVTEGFRPTVYCIRRFCRREVFGAAGTLSQSGFNVGCFWRRALGVLLQRDCKLCPQPYTSYCCLQLDHSNLVPVVKSCSIQWRRNRRRGEGKSIASTLKFWNVEKRSFKREKFVSENHYFGEI